MVGVDRPVEVCKSLSALLLMAANSGTEILKISKYSVNKINSIMEFNGIT